MKYDLFIFTTAICRPDLHLQCIYPFAKALSAQQIKTKWFINIDPFPSPELVNVTKDNLLKCLDFPEIDADFTTPDSPCFYTAVKTLVSKAGEEIDSLNGHVMPLEDDWKQNIDFEVRELLDSEYEYIGFHGHDLLIGDLSFNPSLWSKDFFLNFVKKPFDLNTCPLDPEQVVINYHKENISKGNNYFLNINKVCFQGVFEDVGRDWAVAHNIQKWNKLRPGDVITYRPPPIVPPKRVFTQHQFNNLERYVNLECDLTVKGNILPAVNTLEDYFKDQDTDIFKLFKLIINRQFGEPLNQNIHLNRLAVVKTTAQISFNNKPEWKKSKLYKDFSKYKQAFLNGDHFPPIILTHPNVLKDYLSLPVPDFLFQVDGMHRVMSALEAGVDKLEAYVIVRRGDLNGLVTDTDRESIRNLGEECTWFPRYQEIKEVGLQGERTQEPRYTETYDFTELKGQVAVDFGGNLGQASIEAFFNGSSKIYNFDYQECAVNTAQKISDVLGLGIINNPIDFNSPSFKDDLARIVKSWDWAIYQAIYRTKEINDVQCNHHYHHRHKSFSHIVNNTKKGLFFEGNGHLHIDTPEFYADAFRPFLFKDVQYLGHTQSRPAYRIIK